MEIGVKQAAALLNVSEKTIYRWLADERVPFYRVGAQYRFSREELLRWVASRSAAKEPVSALEDEESISLEKCLRAGGIFYRIDGRTVFEVLEQMLSLMRLPAGVEASRILDLVYEREQMASTGIGEGIALPHCRDLAVAGLTHPLVALGFLEQPVDFKAVDSQPVSKVFLFLSPSSRSSIRIMSRLAYALRQPTFSQVLREVSVRDRLFAEAASVDEQLGRKD